MVLNTTLQYDLAISACREIFQNKMKDYGSAWRILRISSITDQVFIKAQRIRSIEEKGFKKIDEDIRSEFIGIVNYSVIALIQMELKVSDSGAYLDEKEALGLFDKQVAAAKGLMENKNFDYDEAWRQMRISSLTDIILMKLLRVKQIEDHQGNTLISEGVDANFLDMINYAVFALILLDEKENRK